MPKTRTAFPDNVQFGTGLPVGIGFAGATFTRFPQIEQMRTEKIVMAMLSTAAE
jgi:hypothetical protein